MRFYWKQINLNIIIPILFYLYLVLITVRAVLSKTQITRLVGGWVENRGRIKKIPTETLTHYNFNMLCNYRIFLQYFFFCNSVRL